MALGRSGDGYKVGGRVCGKNQWWPDGNSLVRARMDPMLARMKCPRQLKVRVNGEEMMAGQLTMTTSRGGIEDFL